MTNPSPAYDNKIPRKYSARTLEHKLENKKALEEKMGWVSEPKRAILCVPAGMTEALGGAIFEQMLPGLFELPLSLVVRGKGSQKYGEMLTSLAKNNKQKVGIISDDDTALRLMFAGSDMSLFCADPKGMAELEMSLAYGVIPVSMESNLLEDYNPVQESGNAFVYEHATMWQCYASLVRALETFKFPYDWRNIQRAAMEVVEEK